MTRDKTATDLEWQRLVDSIAGKCASEQGCSRLAETAPLPTLADARRAAAVHREALEAVVAGEVIPRAALPDLEEVLERLGKGGTISAEQLRHIARTLAVAAELRSYGRNCGRPLLAERIDSDRELDKLRAAIDRAIEPSGRIADGASRLLANARREVRTAQRTVVERLKQLASKYSDVLRESGHVMRDGRYGLPVRADAHRKFEGMVLGTSRGGATLYVEPPAITQLSNRLRIAEDEVAHEEARIVAELSATAAAKLDELAHGYDSCIEADRLAAIASWGLQQGAFIVEPHADAAIQLDQMRHPLLDSDDVVPNDVTIAAGQALVISGPNAGGKTVALKCLGLAVWLVRSGLPLPARETSVVGWFDEVLSDIGDDQSMERSLSSFSAEVTLLSRYLERAGTRTLILLDELAGGTDPEQGAALATAILEALVERGGAVAVTTHYEALKAIAPRDDRFRNASVGFDFDRMQPTFKLTMGVPGASSAFAVAKRFGLSDPLVARARALQSEQAQRRDTLLHELERERTLATDARNAAEGDARAAEALLREVEEERRHVRDKERARLAREAAELTEQIKRARAQLRDVGELIDGGELKRAEASIDAAAKTVSVGSVLHQATGKKQDRKQLSKGQLRKGMRVYVAQLRAEAELLDDPSEDQVRVQAGSFTLRVPLAELSAANQHRPNQQKTPPRKPKPQRAPQAAASERQMRTSDNTVSLRGMRVDEALEALDRFVDTLIRSNETVGFALHGHGTGALRNAVREHLALSTHIARCRPANSDEGGEAFTVFWLR